MPRRGENIYKRKDGRWEGRYVQNKTNEGKIIKYRSVYGKTYREVKNKLIEASNNVQNNQLMIQMSEKVPSFVEIAEEWIISLKPQIKESTYVKYRNLLNQYILPEFGSTLITLITNAQISYFCNNLLKVGGQRKTGLSAKTVSDILALLKQIQDFAIEKGYSTNYNTKTITIKRIQTPMRVLSRYEQEKLSRNLYSNQTPRNIGILICLYTGIRIGELCALRWENISFEEHTVFICHTLQRIQNQELSGPKTKIIISTPKSSCSIRKIPLCDELFSVLYAHKKSAGYIISENENKYLEPRIMQNYFKKVLVECEIDSANFHALRHTFATRCVEVGFDVKTLSEILGHASVNITMNRYVHSSIELKKKNMQKLSEVFTVN